MVTESPTCLVISSFLSMTTQLFPLSFTFAVLLITLHILHNACIKGALEHNIPSKLLKDPHPCFYDKWF